ncbi:bestrophin-like domain [Streptomyces sp. NPDC055103]
MTNRGNRSVHAVRVADPGLGLAPGAIGCGAGGGKLFPVGEDEEPREDVAEYIAAQEVLAQLGHVDDARRGREAAAQERLSPVLWTGLLIGGTLMLAFMFLFGIKRSTTHVVMVMGLSGFIVFTVLLIHQLGSPFGDMLGATPDAFIRYFPA